MPTSANVILPLVPPRPHVSSAVDEHADKKPWREGSHKEQGRTTSSEWIDVDEDKPRRRRKVRRAPETPRKQTRLQDRRSVSNDIGRFFPKLSQILETSESKPPARPRQSAPSKIYAKEEASTHRRPVQRSSEASLQRQQMQLNASLLSVLSGLTTSTDRSSGSNSTVTQRSYRRRHDAVSKRPNRSYRRSQASSIMSSPTRSTVSYEYQDDQDDESLVSTPESSQHHSDFGSSDAPGTPSSRSTYPSPTCSYGSKTIPRAYHESTPSPSLESSVAASVLSESHMSTRSVSTYGEPSMIDGQYFYREPAVEDVFDAPLDRPLLAPMPAHPSAISPRYLEEMQRSQSHSSASSGKQDTQQALQHYYQQHPIPDTTDLTDAGSLNHNNLPAAPEAPDVNQRTIVGYEKLALELTSPTSSVKPLYRKFEFLNHRLLLHLQDEIVELEESLRRMDEIVAQMGPDSPVSRRGEAYYGADIHHHRTALLGRIFMKTEQYNKAMSSYSAMVRDCDPADPAALSAYKSWMARESPVHEVETRFLARDEDLVMPGVTRKVDNASVRPTLLLYCSVVLILPAALFAIIPTLIGRLAITVSIALTTILLRITTSLLPMLSIWDTSACVTAFVLLMSTVALCVPQHAA